MDEIVNYYNLCGFIFTGSDINGGLANTYWRKVPLKLEPLNAQKMLLHKADGLSNSESTLRKIIANAGIEPFNISYYCERRAPDFESKMHDALVTYKQVEMRFDQDGVLITFEGDAVHTISCDEKSGIQTISTTDEDRPPILGMDKICTYQRDCETQGSAPCHC